ncbi:unnamed protein product, partial [marine sediment metagenome]
LGKSAVWRLLGCIAIVCTILSSIYGFIRK